MKKRIRGRKKGKTPFPRKGILLSPIHFSCFTLIELLVVIGIIAILASLLLPALGKTKSLALTVQCVSNQKQVQQANASYANTYNQFCPFNIEGNICWFQILGQHLGWKTKYPNASGLYYPSIPAKEGGPTIFACSTLYGVTRDSYYYQPAATFCLTGNRIWPRYNEYGVPVKDVKHPSMRVAAFEGGSMGGTYLPGAGKQMDAEGKWSIYVSGSEDDYYHGRHNRSLTLGFFDGHVSRLPSDTVYKDWKRNASNSLWGWNK